MAVKLATGVTLVDVGRNGEPGLRLLILNQTTTNGWVEHLHVEIEPDEADALGLMLMAKAAQLREIRMGRGQSLLNEFRAGTWDGVPGSEEDLINHEEKP